MATSTLSILSALLLAAFVVGVGWWTASRRRSADERGEPGAPVRLDGDALVWCAFAAIFAGMGLVVASVALFGFDSWDVMSLLYLDLVLALPLIAGAILLGGCRGEQGPVFRVTRPVTVFAVVCLLAAPLGVFMTHIEPYRLGTDRESVAIAPERTGSDEVRIGVISDIQTVEVTDHERAAVQRMLDEKPDVILVAGDIFQGTAGQFRHNEEALHELFLSMDAPGGAFLVAGDVDSPEVLEDLVRGTPVELLVNEVAHTTVGDRQIVVGGVELERTDAGRAVIEQLDSEPGDEVRILLSHRPDWALELPSDSRVDLVVAGHTHGGQVQLPFVGPLITMSQVPRSVAAGGLHELDGNAVYVTPGIGREQQGAPQIRFLDPPEVGILTLTG